MMIAAMLLIAHSAPSFNCTQATTWVERSICSDAELARRDRALDIVYRGLGKDKSVFGEPTQQDWLSKVRNTCRSRECLRRVYEERIEAIGMQSRFGRTYATDDGVQLMHIAPVGEGWYAFGIFAIWKNGLSGSIHDGGAAGLMRMANGRGVWRYPDAFHTNAGRNCTLTFSQRKGRWFVRQSTNDACATALGGLNVTVQGNYRASRRRYVG